jgi:hypothetical protein
MQFQPWLLFVYEVLLRSSQTRLKSPPPLTWALIRYHMLHAHCVLQSIVNVKDRTPACINLLNVLNLAGSWAILFVSIWPCPIQLITTPPLVQDYSGSSRTTPGLTT